MLRHPKAPLAFGTVMILALAGYLTVYYPSPGELAASHAGIEGLSVLSGCERCHAEEGLSAGCLACHREISAQLASEKGYHSFLARTRGSECAVCHPEHNGKEFGLVSALSWGGEEPESFRHPHVAFGLSGKHDGLSCDACHGRGPPVRSPVAGYETLVRGRTFLGASQDCRGCHEDVHSGGLSGACESCHGQDSFRPASHFRHEGFPLSGPHAGVACDGCHLLPQAAQGAGGQSAQGQGTAALEAAAVPAGPPLLTFDKVRGTRCEECHASPHRVSWGKECAACHPRDALAWEAGGSGVTPEVHELTGFRLATPHEKIPCGGCHEPGRPFAERYPDPESPGGARTQERCESCHRDVHAGQFLAAHPSCIDCHEKERFLPARFGIRQHEAYPLEGAHVAVPCRSCHGLEPATGVRRFVGVDRRCVTCHEDPHGGQFARELEKGDCDSCHRSGASTFAIRPFDHRALTGYALEGAHAKAACGDCHALRASDAPAGARVGATATAAVAPVREFRGTSRLCSSCHVDEHRGQFAKDSCGGCHPSTDSWKRIGFDHHRQSRFALDGRHVKVDCGSCHPRVKLPSGDEIVQYKPIGTECKDCHAFTTR